MRIVAITGSPRKNGNTDKVLANFEETLGNEHEIEKIRITALFLQFEWKQGTSTAVQDEAAV